MRIAQVSTATIAAIISGLAVTTASIADTPHQHIRETQDEVDALSKRVDELKKEIEEKQADLEGKVKETKKKSVQAGKNPGSFKIPGTDTTFAVGGYAKADFIYDTQEAGGDLFVTEAISTDDDGDDQRFRAHARQSRLNVATATPTDWGDVTTLIEGDFFGGGGNEVFSNSNSFRLRHATATIGGLRVGQYWTNFMPIESYPSTVDFQGPAGIPFIRQAQLRYTHQANDKLSISGSIENSEFNGRDADGAISESLDLGIQAGVDEAPDLTAAVTHREDWGLVKLAGVGRYLGSPDGEGDDALGWGLNLSGNTDLWEGGRFLGSFTYGDGVGRYILNGFGQDAFVEADGDLDTIEAWGVTAQVTHAVTETITAGLAYGRYQAEDTFADGDLDNTNSVHGTVFWSPLDRVTFGQEIIWGNREDADGDSDSNVRLQASVQVNF